MNMVCVKKTEIPIAISYDVSKSEFVFQIKVFNVYLELLSVKKYIKIPDKSHPTLCKSLRNQKVMFISCGEDHTVALTKVSQGSHCSML